MLQGADIVKCLISLRLRWSGRVEEMQNERTPKRIVTATTEGARKRGRPHETWRNEVEEDLKIMGIKKQAGIGQRE
jgi:hypothetical protein